MAGSATPLLDHRFEWASQITALIKITVKHEIVISFVEHFTVTKTVAGNPLCWSRRIRIKTFGHLGNIWVSLLFWGPLLIPSLDHLLDTVASLDLLPLAIFLVYFLANCVSLLLLLLLAANFYEHMSISEEFFTVSGLAWLNRPCPRPRPRHHQFQSK